MLMPGRSSYGMEMTCGRWVQHNDADAILKDPPFLWLIARVATVEHNITSSLD